MKKEKCNKKEKKEIKEMLSKIKPVCNKKEKKEIKEILSKMKPVACDCKRKKSHDRSRIKYGVSGCDCYSMCHSFGVIFSNALFRYIADAKTFIVRDDWDVLLKHAQSIKDYAEADNWDILDSDAKLRNNYMVKERNWREAMFWLTENWQSLWW
jgi:hypothetical protein